MGSANVATADPSVPRPATSPCVVQLFSNLTFADFTPKPFTYTPPAACPAPWAKVVLEVDFDVTTGRQFDRTAQIAIGHVNGPAAAGADDVVVMAGPTGDVGVSAVGQVEPLHGANGLEQVEGAEDRRPADPDTAPLGVIDQIEGGEVPAAAGLDERDHGPARPGRPDANPGGLRSNDGRGGWHAI